MLDAAKRSKDSSDSGRIAGWPGRKDARRRVANSQPTPAAAHRAPGLGDTAALLAQDLGVVGELVLEGQLVTRVRAGVVELRSPYGSAHSVSVVDSSFHHLSLSRSSWVG